MQGQSAHSSISQTLPFWRQTRWLLAAAFTILAAVSVVSVAVFIIPQFEQQDEDKTIGQLESVKELKSAQLSDWLLDTQHAVRLLMSDKDTSAELEALFSGGETESISAALTSRLMDAVAQYPNFEQLFIYDVNGRILAASDPSQVGKIVRLQPYYQASIEGETDYLTHPPFYEITTGSLALYQTYTIMGSDSPLGAVAVQLSIDRLNSIMTERTGLPSTGETILVSQENNYLITQSRFEAEVSNRAHHSFDIEQALLGNSGSGRYDDYRGVPVIGVYTYVPELEAAMIAKIDQEEALSASIQARNTALLITLLTALSAGLVGFLYASYFAYPITVLTRATQEFASGHYDERIVINRRNELGLLASAFNQMADELAGHIRELSSLNEELEQRVIERTHDLEAASQQAEQANKVKSQFLASMSHELRTPLNAILNFTKFVSSGMFGTVNQQQVEALDKVSDSGRHLLSLINDVLDISKIESGALKLFWENDIQLSQEVERLATTARALLGDKPVQLTVDMGEHIPPISGDKRRLYQVMLNIVANACKFTEQGEIRLELHKKEDCIVFAVKDTGPGIDPNEQATVFETFRQTHTGLSRGEGTGLGMAISKRLAEAHGGEIWLDSVLGEGSTFYVSLPLQLEPQK